MKQTFELWVSGCCHVGTDLRNGRESLADAIRDSDGNHVVQFAATLYPGESVVYDEGLAALRMYPGDERRLKTRLVGLFGQWLAGS